jgi:eukaryotic-like serine/threonine-protein kinase
MLTGRSAFEGETIVEILGGVTKVDPDWTALPATTPPLVRSLFRRCLQKDRKRRLRDIADARFQIEEAQSEPANGAAIAKPARNRRGTLAWLAALIVVAITATAITSLRDRSARIQMPEVRAQIVTPPGDLTSFAVSPDGRKMVFQATADGKYQLWLRSLDSDVVVPLSPIKGRSSPFWSPDSKSVVFMSDQALNRIDIASGIAQRLADLGGVAVGGSWSTDGVILFARSAFSGLSRLPAGGGNIEEVTALLPEQASHRFPSFLPDNRHFVFYATGTAKVSGLYLGDLQTKEIQRLADADTTGAFVPPDIILFARQEILYAQKLDMRSLKPVGTASPVLEHVGRDPSSQGSLAVSASASGLVAYRTAGTVDRQLVWFDRSGKQLGTLGAADPALRPSEIRISPDNTTVTLDRIINGNGDVWVMELARGLLRRLTTDPATAQAGVWSPDGREIAFQTYRKGRYDLYRKPTAGGKEELLLETPTNKNLRDWSADGKFLLYIDTTIDSNDRDIWALPLEGERKPFPVVQSRSYDGAPRFSPDTHWVAYESTESGRGEVYVQSFPQPDEKLQISTNGGDWPQWSRDGRELFYVSPDDRLMAVPVQVKDAGAKIEVGKPQALFTMRPQSFYAVSSDGQRFLLNTPLADTPTPPITLILNWAGPRN